MAKAISEELLHLDDERIDWTEEYRERERLRREAEEKLAESRKVKKDETLEKICPPVYINAYGKLLSFFAYGIIREEVEREFAPKEYKTDYRSVTKVDFHSNEIPDRPRPEPRVSAAYCLFCYIQLQLHCWKNGSPVITAVSVVNRVPFMLANTPDKKPRRRDTDLIVHLH
ncbi:hypothetical protein X801_04773 [Opisthorchis viverrini]|uniref:Uncharacterized protein n=1 Tax=Opisthorchis viverrini TaxID=6198 RepID=A0A1S8WY80_OPIVI|nr:hypothetical protein X801_04773 [Opisthorchis viverrini]